MRAGLAQPTAEQKGRRADLPDAMRAKMEAAFGADLSAVKLYESEAVADAGAEAVTRGNEIAFALGILDFTSFGGQALLGHEISHVVSQQRGEVAGGGFLNDHALEARADREGAMAAAGQQISMPTAALSSVSAAPAAGPMQAKKKSKAEKLAEERAEEGLYLDMLKKRRGERSNWDEYEGHGAAMLDDEEESHFAKLSNKHWKRLKKKTSNAEFYDEIGSTAKNNDYAGIPKWAMKWYDKHERKKSRWSGKKGWGTQEEYRMKQAVEAEKRRKLKEEEEQILGASRFDAEHIFI